MKANGITHITAKGYALLITVCLGALIALPGLAVAKTLYIRGAGFGHGVGMSQYGAYGFAKQGKNYRSILSHYYSGTTVSKISPGRVVRVLLQANLLNASFSGANSAGDKTLDPGKTYLVSRYGSSSVRLRSSDGDQLGTFAAPLKVKASKPLKLNGRAGNGVSSGRYRGWLEISPGLFGGVNSVNAVPLESYLRGVVPAESPASWPADALKAQAIAARTYAITTNVSGKGFDQYPDTRSQVYRGVVAENPNSDTAIKATSGEIVTYQGKPITTFFFSTSGGRTENVENSFLGASPKPYLKSVTDPYDKASPKHRWGPIKLTFAQAGARLRGLVKGSFLGIKVLKRGSSPRIISAEVIGTGGRTRVNGPTLRARFGLPDTWAYFGTSPNSKAPEEKPSSEPEEQPESSKPPPSEADPVTGGNSAGGSGNSVSGGTAAK